MINISFLIRSCFVWLLIFCTIDSNNLYAQININDQLERSNIMENSEGWINEVLAVVGSGKIKTNEVGEIDHFIEVALNMNIQDLGSYKLVIYDGITRIAVEFALLTDFSIGSTSDGFTYYYIPWPVTATIPSTAGLSLSNNNVVIPGQFLSFGGSFTATSGDASGSISTYIGDLSTGISLALIGTGLQYSDFTWVNQSTSSPGEVNSGQDLLGLEDNEGIPINLDLDNNYPNPFNPNTTIQYSLPNESAVIITIYDMQGKEINQLISQKLPSGKHSIQWSGTDNDGNIVSAGIYFYQLKAGNDIHTKKMLLIK